MFSRTPYILVLCLGSSSIFTGEPEGGPDSVLIQFAHAAKLGGAANPREDRKRTQQDSERQETGAEVQ